LIFLLIVEDMQQYRPLDKLVMVVY